MNFQNKKNWNVFAPGIMVYKQRILLPVTILKKSNFTGLYKKLKQLSLGKKKLQNKKSIAQADF